MSKSENTPKNDPNSWAKPVDKLKVSESPNEAINLNVDGRKLSGLTHGFGQLWQKTYKVRLSGIEITPRLNLRIAFVKIRNLTKRIYKIARLFVGPYEAVSLMEGFNNG